MSEEPTGGSDRTLRRCLPGVAAVLVYAGTETQGAWGAVWYGLGGAATGPSCGTCGGRVWSKGYRTAVLVDLPAFC